MKEVNYNSYLRCPCCNEVLDDWEIQMYDIFDGMKEDCYNKSMEAAYEMKSKEIIKYLDLDLDD